MRINTRKRTVLVRSKVNLSNFTASSLPDVGEFARGVALLQSFNLAVFEDEFVDDVCELRGAELQALYRNQLRRRATGKGQREAGAGGVGNLKFHVAGSEIRASQFFE